MAIASRLLSRLRQRTQELKAQEQALQRETETLKRETEMLKAQEQALKSETEMLKAQEQTLKRETEMLKNLSFTIESEKPTTPKKEHITLNSLLSSNRTEVSRTANLVFNVPFSRMNETMRPVNSLDGRITNMVVSGGDGASGGQAVAPRQGWSQKRLIQGPRSGSI
jgi:predicted RNase H-like nuclease (RuvC/YqgF family)